MKVHHRHRGDPRASARGRKTVACIALCLAHLLVVNALGTTVEPIAVTTAADYAGQVLVATVTSVRSYWADSPRRIESEIQWERVEYLKGAPTIADGTFRLIVQGGSIGTRQMRIAGAPEFREGERWLLFLLPSYKTHPVVGVHQYALRIVESDDGPRVLTAAGEPVLGFDADGYIAVGRNRPNASPNGSTGTTAAATADPHEVADGTRVLCESRTEPRRVDGDAETPAELLSEFVAALRPALEASRRHDLDQPAGRPDIAGLTPTSLRAASPAGVSARPIRPSEPRPEREDVPRPSSKGDR